MIEVVVVAHEEFECLFERVRMHSHWHMVKLALFGVTSLDFDAQLEWWSFFQVWLKDAQYFVELDFFICAKDGLQLTVKVDSAPVIRVLQPVLLNVLPQRGDNSSASLLFDAKHFLQWLAQDESFWRVIEPQADFHHKVGVLIRVFMICRWEVSLDLQAVKRGTTDTPILVPYDRLVNAKLLWLT